ncbi:alpha/beta fold hydrolase [Cellulomonas sp. KRMCY2]|uniref:alpha/beta fold hydrolase n=1 Tax=Cellulomonas sp. KRMCY2 TaxID=1304865 RepID=UPI0004A4F889|nr:alpha/beta hydrolase [Cellulomonas sp. KRMCY2]
MSTHTPELHTSHASHTVHVVLVPGFWLGGWAWDDVLPGLRDAGLVPHAVTLPGLDSVDDDRTRITLDDHLGAVLDVVDGLDALDDDVVLVGHSGGGLVVHGVVDRRPGRIRRVVYVDSGPMRDGVVLRPEPPAEAASEPDVPGERAADVPLPSWEALEAEGSSLAGLDDAALARFRERAVPHPTGVAATPLHLADARRLSVPVTLICTSMPSTLIRELVAAGQLPAELPDMTDVEYVDLPTGHWPMFSRPVDLAHAIAEAALR